MGEYEMQELAEFIAAYYRHEPEPDYTADGLLAALRWATDTNETVAGWSANDVLDRARDEFDLQLTTPQAREILARVATTDVNWDAVDYCIQKWKDEKK